MRPVAATAASRAAARVLQLQSRAQEHPLFLELARRVGLAPGVYLLRLVHGGKSITRRAVMN